MVLGGSWWLLLVLGGSWLVFGFGGLVGFWQFLVVLGGSWGFLLVLGSFSLVLTGSLW